jgi:hypothetical protein
VSTKLVIRRDPLDAPSARSWPWPWRIYCAECSRIRRRYEVGDAQTFEDVVAEACHHAWFYHEVAL